MGVYGEGLIIVSYPLTPQRRRDIPSLAIIPPEERWILRQGPPQRVPQGQVVAAAEAAAELTVRLQLHTRAVGKPDLRCTVPRDWQRRQKLQQVEGSSWPAVPHE